MMSSVEPALTVVLVGPMAAGKTSIGRRIARLLNVAFIDTDKRIVASHGPIPEIFATQGEAHFRELERAAVAEAIADGGVDEHQPVRDDHARRERLRAAAALAPAHRSRARGRGRRSGVGEGDHQYLARSTRRMSSRPSTPRMNNSSPSAWL